MVQEYYDVANRISEMADACDDDDTVKILKAGCSKIFELAKNRGGLIKTASVESNAK